MFIIYIKNVIEIFLLKESNLIFEKTSLFTKHQFLNGFLEIFLK